MDGPMGEFFNGWKRNAGIVTRRFVDPLPVAMNVMPRNATNLGLCTEPRNVVIPRPDFDAPSRKVMRSIV